MTSSMLEKSNMMYLSKEATTKDRSLKTQVLLVTRNDKTTGTEKTWKKAGFLGDQTTGFTINKANFPENKLVYANQGNITLVKDDLAIYLDYVVLGQLIPAKSSPQNLEDYECLPSEVKLVVPLYDLDSGKFFGFDKCLAFIMVRGDYNETFFSYGYDKANQTCFIRSLKKFCRIYLVEPALKNINNLCLTNG